MTFNSTGEEARALYFYCKALGYNFTSITLIDWLGIAALVGFLLILMIEGYFRLRSKLVKK